MYDTCWADTSALRRLLKYLRLNPTVTHFRCGSLRSAGYADGSLARQTAETRTTARCKHILMCGAAARCNGEGYGRPHQPGGLSPLQTLADRCSDGAEVESCIQRECMTALAQHMSALAFPSSPKPFQSSRRRRRSRCQDIHPLAAGGSAQCECCQLYRTGVIQQ